MSLPFYLPALLPAQMADTSDTGGVDGTLAMLTSHCEAAKALILAQYADSPRLLALLCSYVTRLQDLEQGLVTLYQYGLDVDTALDASLDVLGAIVRESRDGRGDDEYRSAIKVRVLINRSQGRLEDMIAIASTYERGAPVRVRQYQPARITVRVSAPSINTPGSLDVRLRRAKAAGVALQTITHPAATEGRLFRLGRATDALEGSTTEGLSWTGDLTIGGRLAHVLG